MDVLPNLRQQRGQVVRKLTILLNTLVQSDKESRIIPKEELQVHFEQLIENKRKYDDIQLKIISTVDNPMITDDFTHEENFEAKFFELKSNLLTRLNVINSDRFAASTHCQSSDEHNSTVFDTNTQFSRIVEQQNRILEQFNDTVLQRTNIFSSESEHKLPALHIPTFSGRYEDWVPFHDLYVSLVHENDRLSDIKKFQYLKTLLKDDAATLLKHTLVSDANYHEAWEKLKKRYSKKIPIVSKHIQRFLDQPIIKEPNNASAIRRLYDTSDEVIRALKSLKAEGRDYWLVHIALQKLDHDTKRLWAHENGDTDYDWQVFMSFLERQCVTLESSQQYSGKKHLSSIHSNLHNSPQKASKTFLTQPAKCKLGCLEQHGIYHCPKFLSSSIDERIQHVKKLNLCLNCLRESQNVNICRSRNCKYCSKKHSSLLCFSQKNAASSTSTQAFGTSYPVLVEDDNHSTAAVSSLHSMSPAHVFLSTAVVFVYDSNGAPHPHRALLDSASQSNFVTRSLATKLGLATNDTTFSIQGIGKLSQPITKKCNMTVRSRESTFNKSIEFLIINHITTDIPQSKIDTTELDIPNNLILADPYFNVPDTIDLLLGAEYFYTVLLPERLDLGPGKPVLQNSAFGWLVTGRYIANSTRSHCVTQTCLLVSNEDLDKRLSTFWEIDSGQDNKRTFSMDETLSEQHFLQNTTRDSDGRFIVSLPFNEKISSLGSSVEQAIKRLHYLEARFTRDSNLKLEYDKFIREYIALGHMTAIGTLQENGVDDAYYLPHHGVWKLSSSTTRLRVVFDGSSKSSTGISLNETLMIGRPCQDSLFNIIIRFRTHNIVLLADIEKMFRQVWVRKEDRRFQRILWRFNTSDPINVFEMNTITYGLSCSPYLSTRCLVKLVEDSELFPQAKRVLLSDVYMDDVLTGCKTIAEAKTLQREMKELLQQGGFNLRKWVSNSQYVLDDIPSLDREISDIDFNLDEGIKTLGLRWHPLNDNFKFTTFKSTRTPTKRIVLSEIAKLFDPLGLLGPTVITAKLLMQELWKRKISWDDYLPADLSKQWESYQALLIESTTCVIPRKIIEFSDFSRLELHGFCDASEQAYGASLYIHAINTNGLISSRLLCSKSRVAPIKRISLPRLELCGAHLLALLIKQVTDSINLNLDNIICWSDSMIVLAWISGDPSRWKTFVSNRVNEIVSICKPSIWHHVATDLNPSDLLTRSNNSSTFLKNSCWWHGPQFLLDSTLDSFTETTTIPDCDRNIADLELRSIKQTLSHLTIHTYSILDTLINTFSVYSRLLHVLAYCFRFILQSRKIGHGHLTLELHPGELDSALLVIIKHIQRKYFASIIDSLKTNRSISKLFLSLNLFVDVNDILRVGGRIAGRNPILLPSKEKFTQLLFDAEHKRLLHAGPQLLLASIRVKFWPLNGRDYARRTTRKCVKCFRTKPTRVSQLMADLPEDRIRMNRAFKICGIDYGGPISILQSKGRGAKTTKAYIALFVCFTTKAIHLEVVSELTTSAFLAALRRFISRRGRCARIYSDNATNFVGAKGELKDLFQLIYNSRHKGKLQEFATDEGIEWKFIAAGSPHQGGLWEAGIKSTKYHLQRVLKPHNMTFEELTTLLVQIEACLNSRPLTPLSSDPNDLQPLTPAHFLIGEPLTTIPDRDFTEIRLSRLSRWQIIQQCLQHFWKRWSQEYLSTLYLRSKWCSAKENLKVGDLVLIREENRPPMQWNLGRVSEVFVGSDGLVRTVQLRTKGGFTNRAIHKLCKLPVESSAVN